MGNVFGDPALSAFQQKKLLHEFHTFFDLNKDGTLEWKDFDLARKQVCEMSGWPVGSQRYTDTQSLFIELWRRLQDDGDSDCDGKITCEEWLKMWEKFNANSEKEDKKDAKDKVSEEETTLRIPEWLERYIEYKFNLLDRAADGHIDVDEFEYVISNFGVPAKDARSAFLMFSQGNQKKVDRKYFRELTAEFFRSDDPSSLGNFITGKLEFS
ncbi:calexcitin-2-like [Liolophura sinensis]|uniref:calexcitin-2-like n=1 Tax=Liolophura sinensis TaxID=3198878 RepID=UPI0031583FD9